MSDNQPSSTNQKEQKLLRYFRVCGIAQMMKDMYGKLLDHVAETGIDEEEIQQIEAVLNDELLPVQLEDIMECIYEHIDEADLDKLIEMYESDFGERLRKLSEAVAEAMVKMQPKWYGILEEKLGEWGV
jgi:flagellar biosynthesis component FlhA